MTATTAYKMAANLSAWSLSLVFSLLQSLTEVHCNRGYDTLSTLICDLQTYLLPTFSKFAISN